jgi:hypothetical protein
VYVYIHQLFISNCERVSFKLPDKWQFLLGGDTTMNKEIAMRVEGVFTTDDDTPLTWDEFIARIEKAGLLYTGLSLCIDEEGNIIIEDAQ